MTQLSTPSLTSVINDGKRHYLPESVVGKSVVLFYRGKESRTIITSRDLGIEISHNGKVHIGSYISSDPHDFEDLSKRLLTIDVKLVLDDPRKRAVHLDSNCGWQGILARAGYGPEADEYERTDGLVFAKDPWGGRLASCNPYLLWEVTDAAQDLIDNALNWAEDNLKTSTIKSLELEKQPYRAVKIQQLMKDCRWEVIRVKVGDTVEVPWQGSSYFGSGGGWGSVSAYGEYKKIEGGKHEDNGFCRSGTEMFHFDKGPAVVFTSAGDDLSGGRTFYRKIYLAEEV